MVNYLKHYNWDWIKISIVTCRKWSTKYYHMKVHNCINGLITRLTSTVSLYIMNVTGKRAKKN